MAYASHASQWELSSGTAWRMGAAQSPFQAGGFYTPEVIAQLFRDTAGKGTMTDAEFVQFATAHGIPEQSLRAAYGILTNASASVYPLDQRVSVLRSILQSDPSVSYANIVQAAAAYGIPEPEVREAYAVIVREVQQTIAPPASSGTVTNTRPPPTTGVQPIPLPVVVDTGSRSDNWMPPGWSERQLPAVLPPVTTPGAVSSIAPMPRDLEAGGGGLFPTQPSIPGSAEFSVGELPPESPAIPPVLIAAGIGALALAFLRK